MNTFVAYFDTLGFEWIFNTTDYEKRRTWAALTDTKVDFPIPRYAILRAQANPQRFPEIWVFQSEISLKELNEFADEHPQALATAIRSNGHNVFRTHKPDTVINQEL